MDLNARLKSIEKYQKLLTTKLNEVIDRLNETNPDDEAIELIDPTDPEV